MKRLVPLFLLVMVIFTFAVRSVYLWRDFVFVYDQGRDALAVAKILHADLTLVGPTTGLFGVFLGPFYYYLLALLYFVGGGNPIIPAYVFVFLSALAILPIFVLGKKIAGRGAGALAVLLYAFSFLQWQFSRWLSNPTALPLVVLLMFVCVLKALQTKKAKWFALVGLLLGICLQLEAANAVFLIPTLLLILIVEYGLESGGKKAVSLRKRMGRLVAALITDIRLFLLTIGVFALTLLPQLLFEILHGFTSTRALLSSFGTMKGPGIWQNLPERSKLLFELYAKGLFWRAEYRHMGLLVLVIGLVLILWLTREKLLRSQALRVVLLWLLVPLFFHLIYTGNYGNFWDYYMIAQYPAFYLTIGSLLVFGAAQKGLVKVLSLVLLFSLGLGVVVPNTAEWLRLPKPYEDRISLSLQLDAINWLEGKAAGQPFGMWAYTPSAQDDVYKYLFAYTSRYNGILPVEHPENTRLMFLIVEDDPNNPKRREQWIDQMSAIGKIVESRKFGAVTVFEVERK